MALPSCVCGECRKCKHAAYMREWYRRPGTAERVRGWAKRYREENLELVREKDRIRGYRVYDPEKVKARKLAQVLDPQACASCGADNAERHHTNYQKPLEVIWLCRSCHGIAHRKVA